MGLPELLCAAVLSIGMPRAEYACSHMDLVVDVAKKNDIQPEVMVSLIHVESRWTPTAVSHANACGLTQVIPKYTGGRASKNKKYTCDDLKNPVTSILAGGSIFNYWLHRYGKCARGKCNRSNYITGLCGYNAGFRCKGSSPNRSGIRYATIVLGKAQQIKKAMRRIKSERQDGNK